MSDLDAKLMRVFEEYSGGLYNYNIEDDRYDSKETREAFANFCNGFDAGVSISKRK